MQQLQYLETVQHFMLHSVAKRLKTFLSFHHSELVYIWGGDTKLADCLATAAEQSFSSTLYDLDELNFRFDHIVIFAEPLPLVFSDRYAHLYEQLCFALPKLHTGGAILLILPQQLSEQSLCLPAAAEVQFSEQLYSAEAKPLPFKLVVIRKLALH